MNTDKQILKLILSENYFINYYEHMKTKKLNELLEILDNTLKYGSFALNSYSKHILNKNNTEYDLYCYKQNIDNSKAIFILNYLIQNTKE